MFYRADRASCAQNPIIVERIARHERGCLVLTPLAGLQTRFLTTAEPPAFTPLLLVQPSDGPPKTVQERRPGLTRGRRSLLQAHPQTIPPCLNHIQVG